MSLLRYQEIVDSQKHTAIKDGIHQNFEIPTMFDFQKHITKILLESGRKAAFIETGFGKTVLELCVAVNYRVATNKPVLIITPLAVAFQFLTEAQKFGIDGVEYSKNGKFGKGIVVCNYERLHYFNPSDFDCVILDESSILKNPEGVTKHDLTLFIRKIKYRFLFTATPSPNDYDELGTSSEALGYMGYTDMLGKFFINNSGSIALRNAGDEWRLRIHAEKDFWRFVGSWAICMKQPSDLGFSNKGHDLPPLVENLILVKNKKQIIENNQLSLPLDIAPKPAITRQEIAKEVNATISERCEIAFETTQNHKHSVYWVNLNSESSLLKKIDKDSVEITGGMDTDTKESILIDFSKGNIKNLITKPKITCFGLNWQHCCHSVNFPTYSFEQYYQSIKRFHRYPQKETVTVDIIASEGQKRQTDAIRAKAEKAKEMYANLVKEVNSNYMNPSEIFNKKIQFPNFLTR